MAKKYLLLKRKVSTGTNDSQHIHEQTTRGAEFNNREILVVTPHRRHTAVWTIVGIVVSIIVLAAIWMNSVITSLNHLNQAVYHDSSALSKQQTQLSAIQTQLNAISVQLTQIQDDLRTFFVNLLTAIHHG